MVSRISIVYHALMLKEGEFLAPAETASPDDLSRRMLRTFRFGGSEEIAAIKQEYLKTYRLYGPLWALLTKDASFKVRQGNYERIFDQARNRVRVWEASQLSQSSPAFPLAR